MGIYNFKPPKSSLQSINEVYFGESKELIDAQKQLSKFRAKYTNKNFSGGIYNPKMNTDPDLLEFNRKMEKLFGFDNFALIIDSKANINACTVPLFYSIDAKDPKTALETTSSGYRFKKSTQASCIVYVNYKVISMDDFTDREVFAVILHEIGHNFAACLTGRSVILQVVKRVFTIFTVLHAFLALFLNPSDGYKIVLGLSNSSRSKIIDYSEKIKREKPEVAESFDYFMAAFNAGKYIAGEARSLQTIAMILTGPAAILGNLINNAADKLFDMLMNYPSRILFIGLDYSEENVSDSFATAYGYGSDLISALRKFDKHGFGSMSQKAIMKVPIFGHLYNLEMVAAKALFNVFDAHPDDAARATTQLRTLRRELEKDNIDPKIKKRIKVDILNLEREIEKATDLSDMMDPIVVNRAYFGFLYHNLGGDIREIVVKDKDYVARSMDDAAERTSVGKLKFK